LGLMELTKTIKTCFLPVILLSLIPFVIYFNSFKVPFILDDFPAIRDNKNIQIQTLAWDSVKSTLEGSLVNRPLAKFSFALNYYFGHYNVKGYHLANLIIHILTGLFLFFLFRITLFLEKDLNPAGKKLYQDIALTAFIAALLWIVHPVNTQSVTYIVQRMNSMAAMFYTLSLLLYAKARISYSSEAKALPARFKWVLHLFGCLFSGIFALASKPTAATLPIAILAYEWFFFQSLSLRWLKKSIPWIIGLLFLLAGLSTLYFGGNPLDKIYGFYIKTSSLQHFSMIERINTEFRVLVYYVSLFFFPHPMRLHLDYIYPLSQSLVAPITTVLAGGTLLLLLALAFYGARRHRVISFCILWFFITLSIESSFIGLAPIFEHRTYLPFMMISLMTVIFILKLLPSKKLSITILCMMAAIFSMWTFQRNHTWQDRIQFWEDNLTKSPNNPRPYFMLGNIYFQNNRFDRAKTYYENAISLKGDYQQAYIGLGETYVKLEELKKATSHFEKARLISPWDPDILIKLGNTYFQQEKWQQALRYYGRANEIAPQADEALYGKALALSRMGRQEKAINNYKKLIRINPEHVQAHKNMADIYFQKQDLKLAMQHYKQAIALNPDYVQAHFNLAVSYLYMDNVAECTKHLKKALEINPNYQKAKNVLKQIRNKQKGVGE